MGGAVANTVASSANTMNSNAGTPVTGKAYTPSYTGGSGGKGGGRPTQTAMGTPITYGKSYINSLSKDYVAPLAVTTSNTSSNGDGGGDGGANGGAGIANRGGGGGGSQQEGTGGNGGSGTVVIRYADTNAPATSTTGSPSYVVGGGYRIYEWTSSGSITF